MVKPKLSKRHITLLLLRIVLPFIIFLLIFSGRYKITLYVFVFTAFVAFLDGFISKKNNSPSQIRSILDPFADKLFINLTAAALFITAQFPLWVLLAYLAKDIILVASALVILIKNNKTVFRSNAIDKISVFVQVLALIIFLIQKQGFAFAADVNIMLIISVVFAGVSFIVTLVRSGAKVVSYKTELEEIKFKNLIKLPDLLTLANILMGLLSILLAIRGNYGLAVCSLLAAVVFDYFDGKVARLINREGDFGKQLDSLADTISFGVAPAIFGLTLIQTPIAIILFVLFLFAGVLRLARYNVMEFDGEFAGMPITLNGIIIPLIYFANVPVSAYPYIYLFLAILMVSPIKVKKIF